MNNLLKIFLIFNLFSSVGSSVNNYSVPLPEAELKMGQNSSEIVKREEPITLVGGTTVWGFSQGDSDNGELQRPCTLGFPVKNKEGRLGFLTSYTCSDAGFFVQDDKNGLIKIGTVYPPNSFITKIGVDYMFVSVYEDYWLDKTSQGMLYSIQCGESNELLPILPSTAKTLTPNFEVCTFGGIHKEMVCGEILELDVTIQVPSSVDRTKKFVNFAKVVKVKMNKDYDLGYLGAPVYIPIQVPNSNKFVASPVGQIIETFAQFNNEGNQDKNIWYYIPLDRILEYSGLKLESGDLSSLLPKSEEPNDENLNNVPLTDNLTMSSNASDVNLVERQPNPPQVADTHSGLKMWIFRHVGNDRTPIDGDASGKKCTLGFAVRKTWGASRFDHGFLTLGSCMHGNLLGSPLRQNSVFYTPAQNWVREQVIRLGIVTSLRYDSANGLNYAILRLPPNNAQRILWNDDISADTPVMWANEERMVDTYNQARRQNALSANQELCWWGSASGHMCGTIEHTSTTLRILNPWRWPVYAEVVIPLIINGLPIPVHLQWEPEDTFQNLIKVRLDEASQPHAENSKEDWGSPVYFPFFNNLGLVTHAQPVGILFKYVQETENRNDQCVRIWYMYCISVDRIMSDLNAVANQYELIGENFA